MTSNLTTLSKRRQLLFILLSIFLIPVLAIGMLEFSLRLFGFGYNPDLLLKTHIEGQDFLYNNHRFTRTYFHQELSKDYLPFSFPRHKDKNTFRIFILGGSAAAGFPDPAYNFGRILSVMLKNAFPNVKFEIINTANVAINSHVVRVMAKELVRYHPDMFLIYMGNNEVVGPYGPGTVFAPFCSNLTLIRAGIAVRSTRIGQLFCALINRLKKYNPKKQHWKGMEMFAGRYISADDKRLTQTKDFFKRNLTGIITTAQRNGTKIILSTVSVNLRDIAPFGSEMPGALAPQWNALYRDGAAKQDQKAYRKAIELYLDAAKIYNKHADLHFRLAQCYDALHQNKQAQTHYNQALELDTMRFRADTGINAVIHKVASRYPEKQVAFLDAEDFFKNNSAFRCPGKEFFYEHVHFTFHGNYTLAKAFFYKIQAALPPNIRNMRDKKAGILSEADCGRLLAFTEYDQLWSFDRLLHKLVNEFPFTQISNQKDIMNDLHNRFDALNDVYKKNGFNRVVTEYLTALQRAPQDPWLNYNFGRFLLEKKPLLAIRHLTVACRWLPSSKDARDFLRIAQKLLNNQIASQ